MKVIASGRKTSRTTQLIERCNEINSKGDLCYIICHTHGEAYRIAQKAKELGYNIPFPIDYVEFLRHEYSGQTIRAFLIDNADFLLQSLTPIPIDTIVVHKESVEL
jgi:hypothetical protein